ncbi:hypothetical protein [Streptomyces sp. NPDC006274]|uniref:hypothetical protein n=1 Tax=unclassified Streptomyces TaxID=2593676 RepID=UPI0033B75221
MEDHSETHHQSARSSTAASTPSTRPGTKHGAFEWKGNLKDTDHRDGHNVYVQVKVEGYSWSRYNGTPKKSVFLNLSCGAHPAVRGAHLTVDRGEVAAITSQSGSGKSSQLAESCYLITRAARSSGTRRACRCSRRPWRASSWWRPWRPCLRSGARSTRS